jgi:hypothetical protein
VRKGVEQHVVLVQDGTYFYSLVFFAILLTMIGTLKNKELAVYTMDVHILHDMLERINLRYMMIF